MRTFQHHFFLACLWVVIALLSACGNKTNKTTADNNRQDTDTVTHILKHMEEMSITEVEKLFEGGGYYFARAGYDFDFVDYLKYDPSTMHYPFTLLQQSEDQPLSLIDTEDGRIRCYSWMAENSGTYTGWYDVYQIYDEGEVFTFDNFPGESGGWSTISKIVKLPHPTKNYYLIFGYIRVSGSEAVRMACSYQLQGHKLKKVKLFRDVDGNLTDQLDYDYNPADYYFRIARAMGFDYHFYWDKDRLTLYYPKGCADSPYFLSDRYLTYQWTNQVLEPQSETGNPDLYPSLQDYACIIQAVLTPQYFIRIDSLNNGILRYAAWMDYMSRKDEPSMLLENGKRKNGRIYFDLRTTTYAITLEDHPKLEIYYIQDGDTLDCETSESISID